MVRNKVKTNSKGVLVCKHCFVGDHLGTAHITLCRCQCDGRHGPDGEWLPDIGTDLARRQWLRVIRDK